MAQSLSEVLSAGHPPPMEGDFSTSGRGTQVGQVDGRLECGDASAEKTNQETEAIIELLYAYPRALGKNESGKKVQNAKKGIQSTIRDLLSIPMMTIAHLSGRIQRNIGTGDMERKIRTTTKRWNFDLER